ncbi:VOC family protein [Ramlibacter tataouinensis]|uniref:VOC family protein n=1 Tax=Ramlibacter tataouinensis TaxID=94132 RepID=UPI0022F3E00C|nr:VOC family protein [Ramlibacter tataouinensis]WBY00238.1 VOC family protein [Ramlibacter tataouinensis]
MPKAIDVAYVIYQVDDLDRMETFMHDFGLVTAQRNAGQLCLRGASTAPVIHVTRKGPDNRFLGAALQMASRADLEALARLPGSSLVEPIDDLPGGGWRVRTTTPDGVPVDGVWGQAPAEPLGLRDPNPFNAGTVKRRINASLRPQREPGLVLRLGHFVLRVSDHAASKAWFHERFGLVDSDYLCVPGDESQVFGTFVRFDCGDEPVDHHSMLITQAAETGVHHCSFEMQDIDAVFGAHDYLLQKGYRLECGVGRHLVGSQIFDYWRDPFDFRVEHYTDGDVADSRYEPVRYAVAADETTQWGMQPPRTFFD